MPRDKCGQCHIPAWLGEAFPVAGDLCTWLRLPYPPSVNRYWRNLVIRGAARVTLSREGVEYRTRACRAILAQLAPDHRPYATPVRVQMCVYRPDRRRRDLDNIAKAVLDALTSARVWTDDSLVHMLALGWAGVDRSLGVEVCIGLCGREAE